ncbi:MAG: hypothetical protein COW24_05485 [Candidatus Kerfeldbacteria bacterium CG15_BIG_FIL_POST_REV_8_21_14_020_45_12]|uniref:Uncharacterized protein n=1 Tax=Candidatus Kerfeldbacteria bacterium CG15_BIG_FIL_POST_REV_8_21_14_020_45_12 TaxID=2014247 RepID=A0A2M7H2G0_9BACT|nr:MAG: hypothetical protein COW24_05485 [Candidatus Kerfeldbacteria bacterium CG15_BIG_FIL_POST_REV_8_21_14_020_45_12]PJA93598.1 MAG: hypothetical protein CO132_02335 [Candidatus Kerfeldbacteria bacterium CG_4_9_14_3_um_filter_45_8]
MTPPPNQDEPTKQQLKLGYWIATHRALLRRILVSTLAAIAGISVLIFLFQLTDWLTHIRQTNEIIASLSEPSANFSSIRKPEELAVRRSASVRRDETTVDGLVELVNPNDIWAATKVEYEILIGGVSTGRTTLTMAPLQTLVLTADSAATSGNPPVQIIIHDVVWKKLVKVDQLPQEDWAFLDAQLTPIPTSDANAIYRTQFDLTLQNRSVLGFRDAEVTVVLTDSEDIIRAIGSIQLVEIGSLESRTLTFRWPAQLSRSLTPSVKVNIDKLTEDRIIRKLSD